MVKTEIDLDQILEDKKITLWDKDLLQEHIAKINVAEDHMRRKLTPKQIKAYFLIIEHTETICSNTPCINCGLNWFYEYLENLPEEE